MSHHSVESMRDIAFRKGRHGFSSDDDYLRALRGEELEDEFLDEEDETLPDDEFDDEKDETPDEFDDEFDDEEDEPSDEEDKSLDEDEAVVEFEDVIFDVVTRSPANKTNAIFDWIVKIEAGGRPGALTFAHRDTMVSMSITGENLGFEMTCGGLTTRGQYLFEEFLMDVQVMLMVRDTPYYDVCTAVKNILDMSRGYADIWKKDIAKFLAGSQSDLKLQVEHDGKIDMCIRFVRRSPEDGNTVWVLLNPTAPNMELKDEDGHPARLLQWLFKRNNLLKDEPSDDDDVIWRERLTRFAHKVQKDGFLGTSRPE